MLTQGRYRHVALAGALPGAALPDVDGNRHARLTAGARQVAVAGAGRCRHRDARAEQQTLLFLNRRGYAPLTLCRRCGHRSSARSARRGWSSTASAAACTATIAAVRADPGEVPELRGRNSLVACGPGVERIAEEVAELLS